MSVQTLHEKMHQSFTQWMQNIAIAHTEAVLADNWFGQSIWYDNCCQTNIIDDMIW